MSETNNKVSLGKVTVYFLAFVVGSILLACVPVKHLALFANSTGEQSYILLVPLVCGALIYHKRQKLLVEPDFSATSLSTLIPGAVLLVCSYFLGSGSESQLALTGLGLVLSWGAAFRVCYGVASFRACVFELGMLIWIIPLPQSVIDWATVTLQRASAETVDWLFALSRVPFYRDGFIFQLPGQSIEVARQCSGIRSTLSLLFLGLIIAHESVRSNVRRLTIILSTLPIVVLKNGVRIVTLTLLAIYVDPSFLTGSLHHEGGIVFFLIGLVMLMPIIALLRRGEDKTLSTRATAAQAVGND